MTFHFLDIVNRASMNMTEKVSKEKNMDSFGNMARRGIAGSGGEFHFTFL